VGHESRDIAGQDTGIPGGDSLSRVAPEGSPEQEYLDEIRTALVASLAHALQSDPLADVATFAVRIGDVSKILTVPRRQLADLLREAPTASLRRQAERISALPSSPAAHWVVMSTPEFTASASVVLVDHRSPQGTA
jgi:hypothetical protein